MGIGLLLLHAEGSPSGRFGLVWLMRKWKYGYPQYLGSEG